MELLRPGDRVFLRTGAPLVSPEGTVLDVGNTDVAVRWDTGAVSHESHVRVQAVGVERNGFSVEAAAEEAEGDLASIAYAAVGRFLVEARPLVAQVAPADRVDDVLTVAAARLLGSALEELTAAEDLVVVPEAVDDDWLGL